MRARDHGIRRPRSRAATTVVDLAGQVVETGVRQMNASGGPDAGQVLAYDLAHAAAGGRHRPVDARLRRQGRRRGTDRRAPSSPTRCTTSPPSVFGREALWGVEPGVLDGARAFLATYRDPTFLAVAGRRSTAPATSTPTSSWCRTRSAASPTRSSKPVAEHVHRNNGDIPEEIIAGLAEMGAFGLSVPEEYGGYGQRRRARLPRHGRRHRGAVAGLARRRRLAHHPARDPHPRRS